MQNLISLILRPYAAILFLENRIAGALLLLLTFAEPTVGISGLFALLCTIVFAEFAGLRHTYLEHGFYLYNSLLVGLGIGFLFTPSVMSFLFIFLLAVLTFLSSFSISTLFARWRIPPLSLPFALVTALAYLAAMNYNGLLAHFHNGLAHYAFLGDTSLGSYLSSLGSIFFLPNQAAGLVMALILLVISPTLFSLSLAGFYTGVATHALLIGSWSAAYHDVYAFNYILVAMALGGIFLLPFWRNYIYAGIAVALSVIFADATKIFFNYYSLPVFTLPFNAVVMVVLFLLVVVGYEGLNSAIKATPEASLAYYLQTLFRFGPKVPNIALPFSGRWNVYQGFDGEWTHKGAWRYAYDFIVLRNGSSYRTTGDYPEDYHCFGESVLSPVNGYVVALLSDLPDNPIGTVDRINNWGNYIILQSLDGHYIEISHLMQHSILPKVGEYVRLGQVIAKCGNSGYSPQPHLHIQVQRTGILGSETVPFRFVLYRQASRILFHALPHTGEEVEALLPTQNMQMQFSFVLDERFVYERFVEGQPSGTVRWQVAMNHLGEFYLSDGDNRLFFYTAPTFFYFYHYEGNPDSELAQLFKLAPRIPLSMVSSASFRDALPIYLLESRLKRIWIMMIASFRPEYYRREFDYTMERFSLNSEFGQVTFAVNQKGFDEIRYGNILLKKQCE
ncbi:urea transporter [Nitratifractor salsuginis]|uniref:Peptidase M23 n=1 Tax=Nitratifractor salsuginis (strain DSM 16511 / JCM 12458 / E9I37-1) TaxID=749222 RepID=E6X063_NITSE|nr:urea transporter [Nitratifractor salsuginis]ADV46786.1 Peptidase M23 [Nitratifractor salsuginis DSM 16511]